MPATALPIAGTIAIEPLVGSDARRWGSTLADDSSLGALLASFAHLPSLTDEHDGLPVERLVTSTRWSRPIDSAEEQMTADLARLFVQLEAEYAALQR